MGRPKRDDYRGNESICSPFKTEGAYNNDFSAQTRGNLLHVYNSLRDCVDQFELHLRALEQPDRCAGSSSDKFANRSSRDRVSDARAETSRPRSRTSIHWASDGFGADTRVDRSLTAVVPAEAASASVEQVVCYPPGTPEPMPMAWSSGTDPERVPVRLQSRTSSQAGKSKVSLDDDDDVQVAAWEPLVNKDTHVAPEVQSRGATNADISAVVVPDAPASTVKSIKKAATTSDMELSRSTTCALSAPKSGSKIHVAHWALGKFVRATPYQFFCSFVIVANAAFVGYAAEQELYRKHSELRGNQPREDQRNLFELMDLLFCGWFVVELALNFISSPRGFFSPESRKWNFFDTALVCWCVLEGVLQGTITKMSYIRTLRVFRTARVLRIVRVFRIFTSLRLMVFAIMQSMFSLLWVFLLLLLLMYVFSIFFLNAVDSYVLELSLAPSVDDSERETLDNLMAFFGSILKCCASLFQAISGGMDWMDYATPLEVVSPAYRYVFTFFVFFTVFGVLNVVTGAFVDNFHLVSQRDRDVVIQDEIKREKKYIRDVKAIFDGADTDGSGMLSLQEFEGHLTNARVKAFFSTLELDVSHAKALFQLLDTDGTNEVGIEEFVGGCTRLKGAAKSIDVNMLLYESEFMMTRMCDYMSEIDQKLITIERQAAGGSLTPDDEEMEDAPVVQTSKSWRPGARRRLSEAHHDGSESKSSDDLQ